MNRAIELIEKLIEEHKKANYCTDYDDALQSLEDFDEDAPEKIYDAARFETLVNLLNDLKRGL